MKNKVKLLLVSVATSATFADDCTTAAYGQCNNDAGNLCCPDGQQCFRQNEWWSQCMPECPRGQGWECDDGLVTNAPTSKPVTVTDETGCVASYGQCGGSDGDYCCSDGGQSCFQQDEWFSQCLPSCPIGEGWACDDSGMTKSPTTQSKTVTDENGCVAEYGQCGGLDGDFCCAAAGQSCFKYNEWFSQCLPSCPIGEGWECDDSGMTKSPTSKYVPETDEDGCVAEYEQCGGGDVNYCCQAGLGCFEQHEYYSQCLSACPEGWACSVHVDAAEVEVNEDERLVVTYAFRDRCDNYGLEGCGNPAPVGDEHLTAPYRGSHSVDGVWYFEDTVTYEKDMDSLKITITFGHDPLNAQRKRVIMMKADQSQYLEYDQVTEENEYGEEVVSITQCVTAVPDELPEQAAEAMGRRRLLANAHHPMRGDSLLDASARAFHQHVRRTLLGFGHVHINLPHEEYKHLNNVLGRPGRRMLTEEDAYDVEMLDDGEYDPDEEVLSFEPPLTNQNASGSLLMESEEDMVSLGFTEDEAAEALANFSTGVYLQADSGDDGFIAKSLVYNSTEEVLAGAIEWPDHANACVGVLEGFEDGIPSRHELDAVLVPDEEEGEEGQSSRRLLGLRRALKRGQQVHESQHKTAAGKRLAQRVQQQNQASLFASRAQEAGRSLLATCEPDLSSWEDKMAQAGMDEATWATGSLPEPASAECTALRDEVARLYEDFETLAQGDGSVMGQLDAAATEVLEKVQFAEDLEADLKKLETTMTTSELVLKLMGPLPYIGTVMKTLGNGMKRAKTAVITPVKTNLVSFNNKIQSSGIETRACELSHQNALLAARLLNATDLYNSALSPVLYVDDVCTDELPLQDLCQPWADLHGPVNDQVDDFQKEAESLADQLELPANLLGLAEGMLENDAYKGLTGFFDGLGTVLSPVEGLLNQKVSVTLPMPVIRSKRVCARIRYPCGVKMCKKRKKIFGKRFTIRYPCGAKFCDKTVCTTIRYPAFEMKKFSFTVSDIISGVLSMVDFVMDAFERVIEGMVKALGLPDFPSVESLLPSFPNFGVDLPALPDLPPLPALPEQPGFLPEIELEGAACELASASCADDFSSCEMSVECSAFEGLEREHTLEGLGYVMTTSAGVEVSPAIEMSMSKTEGFAGTFTVPIELTANFELDLSAAVEEEWEVEVGPPVELQQSLPAGPLPVTVSFSMQPKLLGRVAASAAGGTVQASLTCTTQLQLDTENLERLQVEAAECEYELEHDFTAEASLELELALAVDLGVAVNDIGATVTPQVLLAVGAATGEEDEGEASVTADATVSVTTVLGVPDWVGEELSQLGTNACAATFELARRQASFAASDCLLTLAEDAAEPLCAMADELFAIELPAADAVPDVELWTKDLLADDPDEADGRLA